MKQSPENIRLAKEIHARLDQLPVLSTPVIRAIRREFSRRVADAPPESVVQLALHLLNQNSDVLRFFSYELLSHHRPAFERLTTDDLLNLARDSIVGPRLIVSPCIFPARCGRRVEFLSRQSPPGLAAKTTGGDGLRS
jgi:hypothetical protein